MRCLLSLALAACVAAAQSPQAGREERLRASIVRVRASDRELLRATEIAQRGGAEEELRRIRVLQPYILEVSGVVISPKGEILTTALHPRAPLQVTVIFPDGTTEAAEVVGTDPRSNLALIRVPVETKAWLELAAAAPRQWQSVELHGIGTPGAVPHGVVARDRITVLQPDLYGVTEGEERIPLHGTFVIAASVGQLIPGGACVDADGKLLGLVFDTSRPLTRAVPQESGGNRIETYEISFAIPAARIARIVEALREKGSVSRAFFGVELEPVSEAVREQMSLPCSAVAVRRVEPGSPAARAGLRPLDILLSVDGCDSCDVFELYDTLSERPPDRECSLRVLRGGRPLDLKATPTGK